MKNIYLWIILILLIIAIIWICQINSKKELFDGTMCNELNKDGMICSIPSSQLFPAKCYKVGRNKEHQDGWYNTIGNIYDCMYYPNCTEIASTCNVPNLFKLEDGYVEAI